MFFSGNGFYPQTTTAIGAGLWIDISDNRTQASSCKVIKQFYASARKRQRRVRQVGIVIDRPPVAMHTFNECLREKIVSQKTQRMAPYTNTCLMAPIGICDS